MISGPTDQDLEIVNWLTVSRFGAVGYVHQMRAVNGRSRDRVLHPAKNADKERDR